MVNFLRADCFLFRMVSSLPPIAPGIQRMNRQQEERRGKGDIVDDACRAELPHQERFSPLIKAEEGQHAGEEAAVDGVFQQVQHPKDEVRAERKNRRRHLIFCAAGDEQDRKSVV